MSNQNELKQRKAAKESKDHSKETAKAKGAAQKNGAKSKAPPPTAAELKQAAEEHRSQMGKKMFWRSVNRIGLIAVAFAVIYLYNWLKTDQSFTPFATTKDEIHNVPLARQVPCSDDYLRDRELFPKCAPKVCGRIVIDNLISERESDILLALFKKALLLNPLSSNQSFSILGKALREVFMGSWRFSMVRGSQCRTVFAEQVAERCFIRIFLSTCQICTRAR